MDSYWGIRQPIRGCPQFRCAAGILGIPLARIAKLNLPIEPVRPGTCILDIQAPERPLGGSATKTAGHIHIAHAQIRILISLGRQSDFGRSPTINLVSGKRPARTDQIRVSTRTRRPISLAKNPEVRQRI